MQGSLSLRIIGVKPHFFRRPGRLQIKRRRQKLPPVGLGALISAAIGLFGNDIVIRQDYDRFQMSGRRSIRDVGRSSVCLAQLHLGHDLFTSSHMKQHWPALWFLKSRRRLDPCSGVKDRQVYLLPGRIYLPVEFQARFGQIKQVWTLAGISWRENDFQHIGRKILDVPAQPGWL